MILREYFNEVDTMKFRHILFAIALAMVFTIPLSAEYVFTKDGSIIQGKIISDSKDYITITTPDKKSKTITRNNIIRILYTELYMGKIFVNLIDGSVIEVYMVDENQNSYTFRKELYKPEEFVVKREDVLFTTRTNPVGLKGEPDTDSIDIEWKAPYTPVKYYRVYINIDGEYKLYSEPWGKSETIKGLKSNTIYKIKVTAVDRDGVESMPSNEITITTKNILPETPENLKAAKSTDTKTGRLTVTLTWDSSTDADGKIKGYKIYMPGTEKVYTSTKTEFEVKDLDPNEYFFFNVSAVDDHDGESPASQTVKTIDYIGFNIGIKASYLLPIGEFGDLHGNGYGATLCVTFPETFIEGFEPGIETGYWQFEGKTSGTSEITQSYMVPMLLIARYRYNLFSSFYLVPGIAAGASFNYMEYTTESPYYTGYAIEMDTKTEQSVEPLLLAGLALEFEIAYRIYIAAGCDYGIVYEESGSLPFMAASVTMGYKF